MLCKVILRAVSISEKSHEVLLNGGSTRICGFIRIPYVGGLVMIDSVEYCQIKFSEVCFSNLLALSPTVLLLCHVSQQKAGYCDA